MEDTKMRAIQQTAFKFYIVVATGQKSFFCVVLEHICYFFADLLTSWQIAKFASIQTWKLGYEFICTHAYTHTLWVKLDSARVNLKETYLTALYSSLQHFPLVSSSSCLLAQIICGTVFRPII